MTFAFSCILAVVGRKPSSSRRRIIPKACSRVSANYDRNRTNSPISLRDVNFMWPNGRTALEAINLSVEEGELAMLVGSNGCGKSTLMKVAHKLIIPDSGTIRLEEPCSYVRQDPDLQIVMPTVGTNIALSIPNGKNLPREEIRERGCAALELVGLSPGSEYYDQTSYRLSGGQRQRCVLAAALINQPRTILFDEVTANIDPFNKLELLLRVRKLVTEQRVAALWVTHLLDELDEADTIIVMKAGKIIARGPRVVMMPLIFEMEEAAP